MENGVKLRVLASIDSLSCLVLVKFIFFHKNKVNKVVFDIFKVYIQCIFFCFTSVNWRYYNTYILLGGLATSMTGYFYELAVFWRAFRRVKIQLDK